MVLQLMTGQPAVLLIRLWLAGFRLGDASGIWRQGVVLSACWWGRWCHSSCYSHALLASVPAVPLQARNVFCAVRPPGHHAGPTGKVPSQRDPIGSHGFCLLNNLAIAAAYAVNAHRHAGKPMHCK